MGLPVPAGGFVEGEPIPRSVAGGGGQRDGFCDVAERERGERVMGAGGDLESRRRGRPGWRRPVVDRRALHRRQIAVDRLADEVVDEGVPRAVRDATHQPGALCVGDGIEDRRHVDVDDRRRAPES